MNKFTKDLPGKIDNFLQIKKEVFDYIFFFKFINKKNSSWTNKLNWHRLFDSEETNIAEKLQKYANENNVFNKKASFSVFSVKSFEEFLKKKKISSIYICGLDTHACVLISTMEAFEKNYDVKVIEDLCASSHGKNYHKAAINILKSNLGKNITVNSAAMGVI